MKKLSILIFIMTVIVKAGIAQEDPFLWLEDVDSPKSLDWVNQQNEISLGILKSQKNYQAIYDKNLEIYNSTDRIAEPSLRGEFIYNFWQDSVNPRGIWRRISVQSYLSENTDWEILLDIDKLAEKDDIKWVFKGATGLYPDYKKFLISLSRGGGDAVIVREFNTDSKTFVENGFYLPEAKGGASWIDENTLIVATDFGEGMTTSGYAKQVKIWKRGTDLKDAKLIFEGSETDMGIWGTTNPTPKKTYQMIVQKTSFYTGTYFAIEKEKLIKIDLPEDIELSGIFNDVVILQLKSDWETGGKNFKQGSVISIAYNDLITGKNSFELIVAPDERSSVTEISTTKNMVLVNMLNNVKSELYAFSWNGKWKKEKIDAPEFGNITLGSADEKSDKTFFWFQNFLEPSSLYYGDAKTGEFKKIKSLTSFFPTENYQVQQYEATSTDGTKIPYFVVGSKNMKLDGNNPTLLYAYGGFEVPRLPAYSAITGTAWLEKGGVYVLANIRGGGEFGPKWHQAGLKENRQRVFDDFYAVAEDLFSRKITSSEKLGIHGGSNGGLLVGVAYTQRPELYKAVVCQVPLFDMKRYNKLLAGASWMAEYGNPDIPEEWEYISKYSPYQNIKPGMNYPEVFFTTSTRDDRVHPGHARKAVAKMESLEYKVYYFENTEGGHAGASTNEQRARMYALIYAYLQMKLMD